MHSCIEDNYDLFIEYFAFERLSSVQMPRLPCRSFSVRFSIFARSRYNGKRIGEKRLRVAWESERERTSGIRNIQIIIIINIFQDHTYGKTVVFLSFRRFSFFLLLCLFRLSLSLATMYVYRPIGDHASGCEYVTSIAENEYTSHRGMSLAAFIIIIIYLFDFDERNPSWAISGRELALPLVSWEQRVLFIKWKFQTKSASSFSGYRVV